MDAIMGLCRDRELVLLSIPESCLATDTSTGVTLRRSWLAHHSQA
jgi:hypothetical protein